MFCSRDHLASFADMPCLIHKGRTLRYDQLATLSAGFARRLPRRRGLIAIEMEPSPRGIAAYLGALQAGHAVMPLPVDEPEIARRLEQRFHPAASWRRIGDRWRLLHHDAPAVIHPDLALLLQTSGSTGQGRGVRLSAQALAANAASIADYLGITSSDRAALVLPLHYSYGLSVLHSHLAQGASLWLADMAPLQPGFPEALEASGATSLAGVPHHFRMLESIGLDRALPRHLSCLTVAGGAMPPEAVCHWARLMQARQGRFVVMYGQTEATARIAWLPPEQAESAPDAVGRAIPGGTLALHDPQGRELPGVGVEGQLIYRGPNVMMGYADGAEDLSKGAELNELATGDLAWRGSDGFYRITGRLSRMSKIAGLRIGHDALEQALAQAGYEAAVWGDDKMIRIAARDADDALARQAAQLAGLRPQHVTVLPCERLPRLANGKIDYPVLRRLGDPASDGAAVQEIFARSFAPRSVRPQDSFVSLGGDSLRHVELSLALDRRLGGLPDGWERQSIAALSRAAPAPRSRVAMPLLVRALAILAVVVSHQTGWPVYGGAAAMMILLGHSVAQHRLPALAQGDALRFLQPSLRVLIPYGLILAGFALAWQQVPWVSVFLVGNMALTVPETHLMLPYLYWFVEVYMQITLLLLVIFWPRASRDLLRRAPFATGLALLALAAALRVTLPELWPLPAGRSQFSLPWVFYLFALGWCVALADTPRRQAAVLLAAAVILPGAAWLGGNWHGAWIKYLSLLAVVAVLLHAPSLPLPRMAARSVMLLAQAAFPIYLLHRLVPEVLMPLAGLGGRSGAIDAVAVLGGIAVGLLAAEVQAHAAPALAARLRRRQPPKDTDLPNARIMGA
ncbi:MAG: AMP-binding protein [Alphaproteobacteria bacterium]|nr:AMP-binding protein [Alphaproteobacteria bacterium]